MGKEVEVVFIEEKKGYFQIGQRRTVKRGYAKNYLLPQNFAVEANAENLKKIESIKKKADAHQEKVKESALETQKQISGKTISFISKTHDETKLYGSINVGDIVEKVNTEFKTTLDKYDFKGFQPIKETGDFTIAVTLHKDVEISITVHVEAEPEKEKKGGFKARKTEKKAEAVEEPKAESDTTEAEAASSEKEDESADA